MATNHLRSLRNRLSIAAALAATLAVLFGGLPADASSAGSISGVIFADTNRDGVRNAGEAPFEGHLLYLFDSSGRYVASATSDAAGSYRFGGLASATYQVAYEWSSWNSVLNDWVPTTTGSLRPEFFVSVSSNATTQADIGWRPIVKSTDIHQPLSSHTGPEGLRVHSYNDVITAKQIYDHMAAEFWLTDEAPSTIVRFAFGNFNVAQTNIAYSGGQVSSISTTVFASYDRWLIHGDYTLAHEYGHAWTNYYNFYVNQDVNGRWEKYLTARGIDPNDSRLGTSHGWMPGEIAAEDYRQLFASQNARGTGQMNPHIPRPMDVPGFEEYLRNEWTRLGNNGTPGATDDSAGQTSEPAPPAVELAISVYKVRGVNHADLSWRNLDATKFDVYRDGRRIKTVSTTTYTDNTGSRGSPSHTYRVCAAGTDTCSAEVHVRF